MPLHRARRGERCPQGHDRRLRPGPRLPGRCLCDASRSAGLLRHPLDRLAVTFNRALRVSPVVLVLVALVGCGPGPNAAGSFDDFLRALGRKAPAASIKNIDLERRVDQAVRSAFCNTAADVVNTGRPKSEQEWVDAKAHYPDLAVGLIRGKVDRITATAELAKINPQFALRYVRSCGR